MLIGLRVMGFHDLRSFSQVLLANQAWHLLIKPEYLYARLLNAKYYPHMHLLDTIFPKPISTCWEGIIYGLELLKEGVIWRVQDASNVNI